MISNIRVTWSRVCCCGYRLSQGWVGVGMSYILTIDVIDRQRY